MRFPMLALMSLCLLTSTTQAATTTTHTSTTTTETTTATATPAAGIKMTGEAFLAANKKKPGVITLPDGLQYKILIAGAGAKPSDADLVTVDYEGKLVDGTEFDSSYKRGEPTTFPVAAVIPGWTEALKLMPTGSTWELYIPSALAYGEEGAPPSIGPNETLIFKVKLIGINQS